MGIHLRLGRDEWGIIFTWDSFQPSTPVPVISNFGNRSRTFYSEINWWINVDYYWSLVVRLTWALHRHCPSSDSVSWLSFAHTRTHSSDVLLTRS